jgi:hypothetical protein
MQPILLNLANYTPNLFGGITVTYWNRSGEKPVADRYDFHSKDLNAIWHFIYRRDINLLIACLFAWHNKKSHEIRYFHYNYKKYVEMMRPALKLIYEYTERLNNKHILQAQAGELAESISLELLRIKPPQEKFGAYMQWFKLAYLVDEFRYRYSKDSETDEAKEFKQPFITLPTE